MNGMIDFEGSIELADLMHESTGFAHCVVQRDGELKVIEHRRHKNKPVHGVVYSSKYNKEKLNFLRGE